MRRNKGSVGGALLHDTLLYTLYTLHTLCTLYNTLYILYLSYSGPPKSTVTLVLSLFSFIATLPGPDPSRLTMHTTVVRLFYGCIPVSIGENLSFACSPPPPPPLPLPFRRTASRRRRGKHDEARGDHSGQRCLVPHVNAPFGRGRLLGGHRGHTVLPPR